MKKQTNILEYVEKYKYKYGISYAQEGGKLVKHLSVYLGIIWVYSVFIMSLWLLSFVLKFSAGIYKYDDFSNVFITTIICAVGMIVAAGFFVCKQKIIGVIIATITQPFIVLAYAPLSVYGMGYIASFYWAFLIPAILFILIATFLLIILVRANIKTNKLYNMLVDGLYKQYGKKDGENLTESEWQEFLAKYNPYKPID